MDPANIAPWTADWLWSLPLIAGTVMFHSFGLALVDRRVSDFMDGFGRNHVSHWISMMVMGVAALCATALHATEGAVWAMAYKGLGALPDRKSAMLYSLNAMTSYGHVDLKLAGHWHLMGALEALNGWILFGLTAAFLFSVIQRVWPRIKRLES